MSKKIAIDLFSFHLSLSHTHISYLIPLEEVKRRAADVGFEQKLSEGRDEILKRNSSLLRCSRTLSLSFFLSQHRPTIRLFMVSLSLSLSHLTFIFTSHLSHLFHLSSLSLPQPPPPSLS